MVEEVYLCVDVETAGPIPVDYAMLSIGACTVFEPRNTFYIELKPTRMDFTPEAAEVHKLSMERLANEGVPPEEAMRSFEAWVMEQAAGKGQPLFVAFNAAFDWMFVNHYFMHYLGHNPFGHTAIDIKAFYMGMTGVAWAGTSWRYIDKRFKTGQTSSSLTHHAQQDALDQAEMFKRMLDEGRKQEHRPRRDDQ